MPDTEVLATTNMEMHGMWAGLLGWVGSRGKVYEAVSKTCHSIKMHSPFLRFEPFEAMSYQSMLYHNKLIKSLDCYRLVLVNQWSIDNHTKSIHRLLSIGKTSQSDLFTFK